MNATIFEISKFRCKECGAYVSKVEWSSMGVDYICPKCGFQPLSKVEITKEVKRLEPKDIYKKPC